MPTGYTSKIYDGEQVTGKEFIMTCARAFGALIEMRDEPMGAQIPEELKVDTHHEKQLERSKQELNNYKNMPIEEIQELVDETYKKKIEENKKYYNEKLELKNRYERVLAEVEQWKLPSPEHQNLKDYAIRQLEESILFDCGHIEDYAKEVKKETAEEYIQRQIDSCLWNIEYHQKEWDKEVKRTNERNLWIKQLRDSLES